MRSATLAGVGKAHVDRIAPQHFHVCAEAGFSRLYFGDDAEKRAMRDAKLIAFEGKTPAPLWGGRSAA